MGVAGPIIQNGVRCPRQYCHDLLRVPLLQRSHRSCKPKAALDGSEPRELQRFRSERQWPVAVLVRKREHPAGSGSVIASPQKALPKEDSMSRQALMVLLMIALLAASGCGGSSTAQQPPSTPAPSPTPSVGSVAIKSISPPSAVAGSPDLTLTITGSNLDLELHPGSPKNHT